MKKKSDLRPNEVFCKIIAEDELFLGHFIITDKPDLQDEINNIGIEVSGTDENKVKALSKKYLSISDEKEKSKTKRILEENGAIIVESFNSVITLNILTPQLALGIFEKKVKKLQTNYKIYKQNYLMITTSLALPDVKQLQNLFVEMLNIQNLHQKKFNKVIFVDLNYIYNFDFDNSIVNVRNFPKYKECLEKMHKFVKEQTNE